MTQFASIFTPLLPKSSDVVRESTLPNFPLVSDAEVEQQYSQSLIATQNYKKEMLSLCDRPGVPPTAGEKLTAYKQCQLNLENEKNLRAGLRPIIDKIQARRPDTLPLTPSLQPN